MSPVLRSAFAPASGLRFGARLLLFDDRIEVRRFGVRVRAVLLDDVEDVFIAPASHDPVNIRVRVRGQKSLQGNVAALSLWKFELRARLDLVEAPSVVPQPTPRSRSFIAAA